MTTADAQTAVPDAAGGTAFAKMKPEIHAAGIADHAALQSLRAAASLGTLADRPFLDAHPAALGLPDDRIVAGRVHLAQAGGRIVGFVDLVTQGDSAEICRLFVDPATQRLGIGITLVDHAVSLARTDGAACVTVVANAAALAFRRDRGLAPAGDTMTAGGRAQRLARDVASDMEETA